MGIMTLILLFQVYLVQDRQHRGAPVGDLGLRWTSCDAAPVCVFFHSAVQEIDKAEHGLNNTLLFTGWQSWARSW